MKKQALSITEAAEMLGVSRPTLYKMIKEGKIPALRLRRRIVIPIDEFNEWVNFLLIFNVQVVAAELL